MRKVCIAWMFVLGCACAVPVHGQNQGNVPPRIVSATFTLYHYIGGRDLLQGLKFGDIFDLFGHQPIWAPGVPFNPDTDVAQEFDLIFIDMVVTDPEMDTETMFNWIRGDSVFFGTGSGSPEPPPLMGTTEKYVPATIAKTPPTATIFIDLLVPEIVGVNQNRLRGSMDWDVAWMLDIRIADTESPDPKEGKWAQYPLFFLFAVENTGLRPPVGPPFADAGPDQIKLVGSTVTLDGSGTLDSFNTGFDPHDPNVFEKDKITFTWEWISGPNRVDPTVAPGGDPAKAQVTLDHVGVYVYRLLVVNTANSRATTDEVSIDVRTQLPANHAPQAQIDAPAGPVTVGTAVTLDGSRSSDPDGDVLSFRWRQTNALGGSLSAGALRTNFQPLSGAKTSKCTWVPTTPGTFYFRLLAVDPQGASNTAMVSLQAVAATVSGETDSASTTPPPTGGTPSDQGTNAAPSDLFGCGNGLALPLAAVPALLCFMRGRRR